MKRKDNNYESPSNPICGPDDAGNERLEERFLEMWNSLCDDASDRGCIVLSTLIQQTIRDGSTVSNAVVAKSWMFEVVVQV
jgi:hypothetical protein